MIKLCKCGCGKEVKNKFVPGHNLAYYWKNREHYLKRKTFEEAWGVEKAKKMKKNLSEKQMGKVSHRKGISQIEEYGEERAKQMSIENSKRVKQLHKD